MKASVIRNGIHMGQAFVEVEHRPDGEHASALHYAVPVESELPLGTIVELSVEVLEVPKEPEGNLEGRQVEAGSQDARVVPDSPIAPETPTADTAPSGQSSDEGVHQAVKEGEIIPEKEIE